MNCVIPPPVSRPGFAAAAAGQTVGFANNPKQSVPNTPFTKWTEVAPTGSSTWTRSKKNTARTTRIPAMTPMMKELATLTKAHGAVIATRPANPPFNVMLRSGFPATIHIIKNALIDAVAAAVFDVTAIWAIEAQSAAIVDPGLKPNHPNHSTNTPIVADVKLCPWIGCVLPSLYLPMRGPSMIAPAKAAQP